MTGVQTCALPISPSGVISIIKEYRGKGPFSRSIMALVAIENLNCIIVFGITTAVLQGMTNPELQGSALVMNMVMELGSEERRVGKEGRYGGWRAQEREKKEA